ncbi:hypothetical protein GCM10007276_13160 [Agaricicola taiwanensis]|uniref:Sarcosine oxidase subunit delta n=1 Tax=Agaricicola taiwanensis TaxID=591372 RepID=A0A8J2VRS5_9RHOB|nr:sarcosine oxidase subunit delta [Agaricicola taiwanensis]GGE37065.1 hypothetical protein GCM10007276_13160 [Agaricicola taiwanensis]
MLLLTCPVCTISADEHAFTCGGDAHVTRPQSLDPSYVSPERLGEYLNLVPSARGWCREQWLCHGCNSWFVLLRHSETNEIASAYRIGDAPPALPEGAA